MGALILAQKRKGKGKKINLFPAKTDVKLLLANLKYGFRQGREYPESTIWSIVVCFDNPKDQD